MSHFGVTGFLPTYKAKSGLELPLINTRSGLLGIASNRKNAKVFVRSVDLLEENDAKITTGGEPVHKVKSIPNPILDTPGTSSRSETSIPVSSGTSILEKKGAGPTEENKGEDEKKEKFSLGKLRFTLK